MNRSWKIPMFLESTRSTNRGAYDAKFENFLSKSLAQIYFLNVVFVVVHKLLYILYQLG